MRVATGECGLWQGGQSGRAVMKDYRAGWHWVVVVVGCQDIN